MRRKLAREFPDLTFFFQPADMVGQILNFGLPAPIDVQVVGPLRNLEKNHDIAEEISKPHLTKIPGAADVHVHQVNDVPLMQFRCGSRARRPARICSRRMWPTVLLISLSSSGQLNPELVGESGQRRGLSGGGADAHLSNGYARSAD